MNLRLMLLSAAMVAVAACASQPEKPLTVHQRYEAACVGAGTAFGVITAVNDIKPLKASQQRQASEAKAKSDKRCKLAAGEDYPYTATEAVMDELESSAATLKRIEGEVK